MKKVPRCPQCGTRRATFVSLIKHMETSGHEPCRCGGYAWPHRLGSKLCDAHPRVVVNRAIAADASDEDIMDAELDVIWDSAGEPMLQFPQ